MQSFNMAPVTHDISNYNNFDFNGVDLPEKLPFGEYLFNRLLSIGTKSIFGVPGDYNLKLLEHLYDKSVTRDDNNRLRWIGCCNELNAAYAADGYSRYLNKIGCVITTYGVGELSALNGIAGACSENVKVLHIVGIIDYEDNPNPELKNRNLHHLMPRLEDSNFLGPNYKVYYEMVKNRIACSVEYLNDVSTACDQVDKVIEDIYRLSKPGYLFVPCTLVDQLVNSKNLISRPSITLEDSRLKTPNDSIDKLSKLALRWLYQSSTPAIIGDVFIDRYGISKELNDLIQLTKIWNFSSVMGKSIIDETNPSYMGLYNGNAGMDSVSEKFLSCDLVLHFGIEINEVNYGHFSYPYKPNAKIIQFHPTYIRFLDTATNEENLFKNINFVDILKNLLKSIDVANLSLQYDAKFKPFNSEELKLKEDFCVEEITQVHLQKIIPEFLNPGDIVVSDTGSFQFAIRDFKLPSQSKIITQGIYLSIGMGLPAALGVGIAMQDYPNHHILEDNKLPIDYHPKLILLVGDGAAQMTVQELTTMLRFDIPMEIFLWNNNGYTIERAIEGPGRSYNDIMPWKWTKLFEAFGDFDGKHTRNCIIETRSQLETKLNELKYKNKRKGVDFMEVKLAVLDFPVQVRAMVKATVRR